jgi:NTE family protein
MARIGLVLGAGGIVGHAFHAGVLTAIEEATGWDARSAEVMVGTSAGSSVVSLLRGGLSAPDLAARALGRDLSPEGRRLLGGIAPVTGWPEQPPREPGQWPRPAALSVLMRPWGRRPGVLAAAAMPEGRIPSDAMTPAFRRLHGDRWPERSLWICAVRLDTGRLVVFGRGDAPATDVASAVRASCAIPGFFQPMKIDGVKYVDGGVHSPTNADITAGQGLDLLVVSSPMSMVRSAPRDPRMAWRTALSFRLAREVATVRRSGIPVVAFQPTPDDVSVMGVNAMDPKRRQAVVRQARESALRRLERADTQRLLEPLRAV